MLCKSHQEYNTEMYWRSCHWFRDVIAQQSHKPALQSRAYGRFPQVVITWCTHGSGRGCESTEAGEGGRWDNLKDWLMPYICSSAALCRPWGTPQRAHRSPLTARWMTSRARYLMGLHWSPRYVGNWVDRQGPFLACFPLLNIQNILIVDFIVNYSNARIVQSVYQKVLS